MPSDQSWPGSLGRWEVHRNAVIETVRETFLSVSCERKIKKDGCTHVSVQVQVGVKVVRARGVASFRTMYDEADPKTGRYPDFVFILVGHQSSAMLLVLVIRWRAMEESLLMREMH